MVGMLKDQPFNQVKAMDMSEGVYDELIARCADALQDKPAIVKPDNAGLQDGMLAYYLSQAPLTEEHESGVMAHEYFNLRDMLEPKK